MLCDKCTDIHFKRIEDCDVIRKEPDRLKGSDSIDIFHCLFYFHHKNRHDLERSADRGCHFCGMLWGRLLGQDGRHGLISKYRFARGEVILRRSIVEKWIDDKSGTGLHDWNKGDWIYIQCEDQNFTTTSSEAYSGAVAAMLEALTSCKDIESLGRAMRGTPALLDDPELQKINSDLVPSRDPSIYSPWLDLSTASPASMALASIWLRNCLENHLPCNNAQGETTLPRRIIDITSPQHPFLDDGNDRKGEYLTLSYKWGESHRYVTTTETESKHRKEIPLKDLPWTFKEAIHVAHSLGFRWIWIDALCILQDSTEDQLREIGLMDQIFRWSTLTLYAAAGNNADAGLSVNRDPRCVKPCSLPLKTTLDGKTASGESYIMLDGVNVSGPLFERGWVLQEEVLASRGLIFGERELAWRCLCGFSTESRPNYKHRVDRWQDLGHNQYDKWRSYSSGLDGFDTLRMWLYEKDPVPDRTPWQRDNQFDHWYTLVKEYSRRSLTYSSDVLPALSGLANALAKKHGCTYVAGLWKEDLQIGLIWYVTGRPYHYRQLLKDRPDDWNINLPSWSWASQWGKAISFRNWQNNNTQIVPEGMKVYSGLQPISPSQEVKADATNSLIVTARVRTVVVYQTTSVEHNDREDACWIAGIKDPVSGDKIGHIALDSDPSQVPMRLVYCLLCTAREKYGEWHLTGLGLVPTDESYEEFTRVGLAFVRKKGWFGELDRLTDEDWGSPRSRDSRYLRTVRIV
ncbi:HET-domain-containing protein [Mytilinidion resinicola]|uniref:HET-domain-containing protein n=1 Tax=Mytilinidion resinicola TaxID=574789 RepID=A0A6A6YQV4_9PEZI|nr:HET-domain-containing protein [Mytilinidion resinicola]KAF2810918.1 HET-domain-containing protein [Mytilinidion resinicola]